MSPLPFTRCGLFDAYETLKFWKFLTKVALNAKLDWDKYTVTIKIEVIEGIDFDNLEI